MCYDQAIDDSEHPPPQLYLLRSSAWEGLRRAGNCAGENTRRRETGCADPNTKPSTLRPNPNIVPQKKKSE